MLNIQTNDQDLSHIKNEHIESEYKSERQDITSSAKICKFKNIGKFDVENPVNSVVHENLATAKLPVNGEKLGEQCNHVSMEKPSLCSLSSTPLLSRTKSLTNTPLPTRARNNLLEKARFFNEVRIYWQNLS